jgi:NADPH:quinone reductase-like Zn-dependent oxidoreductase
VKPLRAALYDRFGAAAVLRIGERTVGRPRAGELRVRVHAAALNPKDVLVRKGKLWWASGRRFPRGTGYDWAGEVIERGPETHAQVGDRWFGMVDGMMGCTVAEELVVPTSQCAPMPPCSFDEAAGLPLAGLTALQALRDVGRVRRGQRVLLLGASGGVGVHAVQIAKALGAHVTATCSDANLAFVRDLGADVAIDYRAEDAVDRDRYDCIFDVFCNRSFLDVERGLASVGTYVTTVPGTRIAVDWLTTLRDDRKARLVIVRSRARDLLVLHALVADGLLRPVVDSVFSLDDVARAHERVETKHARGKVVVRIGAS